MTVDLSKAKPGEIYLTREDEELEYIGKASCPCKDDRYIFFSTTDGPVNYFQDGKYFENDQSSELNIIRKRPEKRVLEGWISISKMGAGFSFNRPTSTPHTRLACVPICIEYEEGDGL